MRKHIIYFLLLPLLTIFILEAALRSTGKFRTQSEVLYGKYYSHFEDGKSGWYHVNNPNDTLRYDQDEFSFKFLTNSMGLREREFNLEKDSLTKRIITLGDSFTEGDGADYLNTWPRYLERRLNSGEMPVDFEIMNAGVCGSDLFYMGVLLENRLLAYQPDLVIFMLNISDVNELCIRGGGERFKSDSTTIFKKPPPIEGLYKYLHSFRAISAALFGIDETLYTQKQNRQNEFESLDLLADELKRLNSYCIDNSTSCLFYVHPVPDVLDQFNSNGRILSTDTWSSVSAKDSGFIHLRLHDMEPLISLDSAMYHLSSGMRLEDYSWLLNRHYNAIGYEMLANCVYDQLVTTTEWERIINE